MRTPAQILVALVALLHLWFLVLEMFLWTRPTGLRAFGQSLEQARASRVLAANQGLYNGFLAAGLLWALFIADPLWSARVAEFFLGCVLAAGIFGGATASWKILAVQALPAGAALAALWAGP